MSHSRIKYLFKSMLNDDPCNGTNLEPNNTEDFSLIINWDKEAIIGVSCILGSMFLITVGLFIFMKRQQPEYTFNVVFKRSNARERFQSVFIPELQIERYFSEEDFLKMDENGVGELELIEEYLQELITFFKNNHRPIETNNLLMEVMKTLVRLSPETSTNNKWNLPTTIRVIPKMDASKKFYLFEKSLPPLMLSFNLFELIFALPQQIGLISLSPNYLPISDQQNRNLNYFKTSISIPKNIIFLIFLNPVVVYSASYGAWIDDKVLELYNWFQQPNLNFMRNLCHENTSLKGKYWWMHNLLKILKFVLLVSVLCEVDVEIETDLQTMKTMNQSIAQKSDLGIPLWLLYFSTWLNFAYNQINDPSQILTEGMLLLIFVDLMELKLFTKWRLPEEKHVASRSLNQLHDATVSSPSRGGVFKKGKLIESDLTTSLIEEESKSVSLAV